MATFHQYSEIVTAYGNRMPPPPPPQGVRLTLPLLYAAMGVVLGTFTGTALAVVSLQPNSAMAATTHFSFASAKGSSDKIHSINNAGQQPVIQNHADRSTANSGQAAVIQPQAAVKVAHTEPVPAIKSHGPSEVAHAVQRTSAPTEPVKVAVPAASSKPLQVASVDSAAGKLPLMHKHVLTGTLSLTPPAAVATVRTPQASSAQPAPTEPAISEPLSMNSGLKSPLFFSEGDVTVVSYSAAGDTIETDDGRSFVVGATVSVSTATSWDDYRANIHYRCDQNGNCTLTRSGVIALNAKLI